MKYTGLNTSFKARPVLSLGLAGVGLLVLLASCAPSPPVSSDTAEPGFEPTATPATATLPPATPEVEAEPTAQPTPVPDHHPRLFFEWGDVESLQIAARTTHDDIWAPIREYVTSNRDFLPPEETQDASENAYRNYGNHLLATSFACVISEDPEICDSSRTQLLIYANWEEWGSNGVRDLGLAHMLMGNALAYDWLYQSLSSEERDLVRESLGRHAQKMYAASSGERVIGWDNWWQRSYLQNHYWNNHSALGIAGLALLEEDDRASMWVDYAEDRIAIIDSFLTGIDDGTWHESIHYQTYAMTMTVPFLLNLERLLGENLFPDEYLQNIVRWRIYNYVPEGDIPYLLPFGDFSPEWGDGYRSENILRFLAARYGDGHAEWMAQQTIVFNGRFTSVDAAPWYVFEFLYYDPEVTAQPPDDYPQATVFSDLGQVVWRTGWESDSLAFSLKAGAYGGHYSFDTFTEATAPWETPCVDTRCQLNMGHDHDDSGGFTIYNNGHWLMPEMATVKLTDTSYHNTILIDEQGQVRPPQDDWREPEAFAGIDARLESIASTGAHDLLVADLTNRYPDTAELQEAKRYVIFVRPGFFVMLDNLVSDSQHVYEWVGHFGQDVSVEEDWIRGGAGDGEVIGIAVLAPEAFQTTFGDDGYPFVRIRPPSSQEATRFINVLVPTNAESWADRPTVTLLEDTGEGAAVRVEMNEDSGLVYDVLINYAPVTAISPLGPYEFDGQAAVIARQDDELLSLFVYGGQHLSDGLTDAILFDRTQEDGGAFEVIYGDTEAEVTGEGLTGITLYAPDVEQVSSNGDSIDFTSLGDYILLE